MSQFIGSWKLTESEKFDELLEAMDINFFLRKFAQTAKPTVNISQDGNKWKIETVTSMKTTFIEFKIGEEFIEKRLDGTDIRTVVKMDGDTMVQTQFADEAKKLKEVKISRCVNGNRMIVLAECGKVVSTRKYTKQ